MRPDEADQSYLWDMLDAAKAVNDFVSGKDFQHYKDDRMLRGAVERHIEIIGEAAGKVSKEYRDSHNEIPWRPIIAQRNVLVHEYGDIEFSLLWKVATERIPELIEKLGPLVNTDEQ